MADNKMIVLDDSNKPALEIAFVAEYEKMWDDAGSGADKDVSFWYPKSENFYGRGFRTLGHYAHEGHGRPESPMVVARPIQPDALAIPESFELVWDDSGSGADRDVSIWIPVPPPGYKALGSFVWNRHLDPDELLEYLTQHVDWPIACVREDLVFGADIGDSIWDDSGSGADSDVGIWRLKTNKPQPGIKKTYMTVGSFCAYNSHTAPFNSPVANSLAVTFPTDKNPVRAEPPVLTSLDRPDDEIVYALDPRGNKVPSSITYLACVEVHDERYDSDPRAQVVASPFYSLEKYAIYRLASFNSNSSNDAGEFTFTYTEGLSETDTTSISNTIGASVTTGVTAGVEDGPVSASVSVSTTLSYALNITTQTASTLTKETSTSVKYTLPARGAGCLYTKSYYYVLKRKDGSDVSSWTVNTDDTHYTSYPSDS